MNLSKLFALLFALPLLLATPLLAQAGNAGADAELVEPMTEVPRLKAPAAYVMKDNTIEIELSEYAGYAGLIAANGGLEPSNDSIFFKKHGFKVKLTLSESESWSPLNSGRIAASATTADVLGVYGKQFQVTVPVQIGFSRGADGILVTTGIKSINQLKGKILAAPQFTEADFFLRYLCQEAGLEVNMLPDLKSAPDPKKVNLVFCGDAEGACAIFLRDAKAGRNRLAGAVGWAPFTTDAVEAGEGKVTLLTTNRNLLVVADLLIVNKGFATANPKVVAGLVEGILEGNRMVRDNPEAHLETLSRAFKWNDKAKTRSELARVHLSNLPENLAFFSGAIDAAGSYNGIYQSALYAYGTDLIKNPVDGEKFLDLAHLKALEKAGTFKDQKIAIAPIKTSDRQAGVEVDPLLSKNVRFLFQPNSTVLDMNNADNLKDLDVLKKLLQVSPGSTLVLRGHVDNAMVPRFRQQGEAFLRQMALRAKELSKNRAKEVGRILTEKYAVSPDRIEAMGIGWDEPLGPDSDQNRRVEVQWFTLE